MMEDNNQLRVAGSSSLRGARLAPRVFVSGVGPVQGGALEAPRQTVAGSLKTAVNDLAELNERLRNLRSGVGSTQPEKQGGNPSNPVDSPESLAAYADAIVYLVKHALGVLADIEREIG
jgi:hypothetical protein